MMRKLLETAKRRWHQRCLAKSLESARRHLSALSGVDMAMASFCMELDPDMCKIVVDGAERPTMWVN